MRSVMYANRKHVRFESRSRHKDLFVICRKDDPPNIAPQILQVTKMANYIHLTASGKLDTMFLARAPGWRNW